MDLIHEDFDDIIEKETDLVTATVPLAYKNSTYPTEEPPVRNLEETQNEEEKNKTIEGDTNINDDYKDNKEDDQKKDSSMKGDDPLLKDDSGKKDNDAKDTDKNVKDIVKNLNETKPIERDGNSTVKDETVIKSNMILGGMQPMIKTRNSISYKDHKEHYDPSNPTKTHILRTYLGK